jgi:DNA-binding transcriptional regulator YiaG
VANFAGVLKGEIRRLARKEVRATVTPVRKLVAELRRRVAGQRKQIAELERRSKRSARGQRAVEAPAAGESQIRFSPKWVTKHRKKLKMSRRVYAKLVGVSAQSIFGWETGRARPRRSALEAWRRIRGMGKRELTALLGTGKAKRGRPAKRRATLRRARRPAKKK